MMTTKDVSIFIAQWDGREFVYSLSFDGAKKGLEEHYAFGDPSEGGYALGNIWANGSDDAGWRICEREVTAAVTPVEIKASEKDELAHLTWQCPYCLRNYSNEWRDGDTLPVLLRCGCEKNSRFLFGIEPQSIDRAE